MSYRILLSVLLISACTSHTQNRNEFILKQMLAINHSINTENNLLNNKILKIDSSFQSIRDSTQHIYDIITDMNNRLSNYMNHNSQKQVHEIMITEGNAHKLKNAINEYCRFMSQPGFKVWNIAKDAKNIEMINTDNLIPFEEYHFKNTHAIEGEIILANLLNEVLNVESRYYTFRLSQICK